MRVKHLLQAVAVTKEMLDRRNLVKLILRDKYAESTREARRIIQAIAKRDNLEILPDALFICKRAVEEGHGDAVDTVIAAAVDLIEEGKVPA
jgi:hypothetical protein